VDCQAGPGAASGRTGAGPFPVADAFSLDVARGRFDGCRAWAREPCARVGAGDNRGTAVTDGIGNDPRTEGWAVSRVDQSRPARPVSTA
jgi:hypothetical protein